MNYFENVGQISGCSQFKISWKLPNYFAADSLPGEVGKDTPFIINSPYFRTLHIEWRLSLIRNGKRNQTNLIGLFLLKTSLFELSSPLSVSLRLINNYDYNFLIIEGETDRHGCFGSWEYKGLHDFSKTKEKSSTGTMRIYCEILERKKPTTIVSLPDFTSNEYKPTDKKASEETANKDIPKAKGVNRMVQSLKTLLLSGQNSDVILKVEDREFNVHKCILMVQSPVFASMLQHDTKENATGIVDIPDCSVKAVEMFLSYVYTGSIDRISSNSVCDLYYIADKYQVLDLKSECVEFMQNNLSIENFCEFITLCQRHSEASLQETATLFFCENAKTISKTNQWHTYMKDYTTHASELYIKAINA